MDGIKEYTVLRCTDPSSAKYTEYCCCIYNGHSLIFVFQFHTDRGRNCGKTCLANVAPLVSIHLTDNSDEWKFVVYSTLRISLSFVRHYEEVLYKTRSHQYFSLQPGHPRDATVAKICLVTVASLAGWPGWSEKVRWLLVLYSTSPCWRTQLGEMRGVPYKTD